MIQLNVCAFYTAGLVEMLRTVDSQSADFPDRWDSDARRMANIVENMCIQSPHDNVLAFKNLRAMFIFNVKVRELSKLPYEIDLSDDKAIQDTMLMYNSLGYSCSQRDLNNEFQDYAQILHLLNIGTNIPAVYFFHGSRIPPEQFFPDENGNGGLNLDHAWESNFQGPRLYGPGSHAGKAAYFARPILYLIMMLRNGPEGRVRSVAKVPDGKNKDIQDEVAIISTRTKRGRRRFEVEEYYDDVIGPTNTVQEVDETFAYPELAIRETGSLYQAGISPLACFYLDKQFLGRLPEMGHLDRLRKERIPLLWTCLTKANRLIKNVHA